MNFPTHEKGLSSLHDCSTKLFELGQGLTNLNHLQRPIENTYHDYVFQTTPAKESIMGKNSVK
jgi:hypothetical protein